MTTSTRTRMLIAGRDLFRERGYDGTGFREVVARAGAARGAIYHHFPGGKAELATEIVAMTGTRITEIIERECTALRPREAVGRLITVLEHIMFDDEARPGCPMAAVAMAAEDPDGRLRASVSIEFQRWTNALADCLRRHGVAPETASRFATLSVASVEGALLLSRASGDPTPLRTVGAALQDHLDGILED
ncbi:MAG: TetR/AcrR family transcriptional regulator [Actinomycetes bacterium]